MREEAEGVHAASARLGSLDESEEGVCIGTKRDPGPARPIAALGDRTRAGRRPRRAEECAVPAPASRELGLPCWG